MAVTLSVEEEATPVVLVFANTFRQSLKNPRHHGLLKGLNTVFAIKSHKDAQAVSVTVDGLQMHLAHGVSPKARVIFTLDFDHPERKPKITGLFRHPLLTMRLGKLLSLPLPDWAESADRFWRLAGSLPGMPDSLKITCSDDNRSVSFSNLSYNRGDSAEDTSAVELVGKASVLEQLLIGNSLLVQEVITGRVRIQGSMAQMAEISAAGVKLMLGELHD